MIARHSAALFTCALLIVFTACAGSGQSRAGTTGSSDLPRAGEPSAEEQSCWKDSECALVDDCCGCASGGLRMSVRQDRVAELTERSVAVCEQRSCAGQPSQHKSCTATAARCLGGRCVPAL